VFSEGNGWITIMRPDGSHRRRISHDDENFDPSWSVRGLIAYTHFPNDFSAPVSIVTRRVDGRFVSRIKRRNGLSNPDFSPDGKLIVFERRVDDDISLWAARPDGSHMRQVVPDGLEPAWSPSGRFIVYSGPVHPEPFPKGREVFIARRDGGHAHQVGPSPRRRSDPPGEYIEPSWQPLPRR
jgi:Tol biopolymer transport system component